MMPIFFGATRFMRRPPAPPKPVREESYGQHPAERVEIIAPRAGTPTRAPIVYIHGGGFIAGKKELYTRYLTPFAEAGYPIFNLDYPLAPEHPHPHLLRSLFAALDWIQQNQSEITGFHVMGDSAGGNLAMMLGLLSENPGLVADADPLRTAGLALRCHSVVSLWGLLDRLSWIEDGFPGAANALECYGGRDAFAHEVGPELAITPMDLAFDAAPPSFIGVGTKDRLRRSSQMFADRLAAGPGNVVHKEYEGERHGFFCFGSSRSAPQLNADILAFLGSVDPNLA
jgi:acetyl esterase